jgi:Ca2+-transporting ATPase
VVALGLLHHRSVLEMAVVGVSLAVAAVPESLPAVVTVALALGARRMARRNAVVRNLPAVETLGSVTVIATDKTGTLTEGRLEPHAVWTPEHGPAPVQRLPVESARLLRDAALCGDAHLADLDGDGDAAASVDPVDLALLRLAASQDRLPGPEWQRVAERPFDASQRRMTTVHRHPDGRLLTVSKGAPEVVLDLVGDDVEHARAAAEELAAAGFRVLAVADRTDHEAAASADAAHLEQRGLDLAGLVALFDPPRAASPAVVAACHRAGIRLLLVTGDHPATATAIAQRVGMSPELDARVDGRGPVFARVLPEEKVGIVESLQSVGEVVAMLGDGVNDGPALRRADIGVAAGKGGTEVARQAADLVLMDDDLGTVVAAVEEGRRVLASVRAFLVFALAGGVAEVAVMLVGPPVGIALPLTAAQILWINLVTHGLTGVAFGAQPADPDHMTAPPVPVGEALVGRRAALRIGAIASALTAAALTAGLLAPADARSSVIFLVLGLGQLGVGLAVATPGAGARGRGVMGAMVGLSAALMVAAIVVPAFRTVLDTVVPGRGQLPLVALALLPGLVALGLGRLRKRTFGPPGSGRRSVATADPGGHHDGHGAPGGSPSGGRATRSTAPGSTSVPPCGG